MAESPHPGPIALTHFIVSDDVERSQRFYTEVLGGETVRSGEPTIVALATAGSSSTSAADPPTTSRR
jgi:catechol 2,3-dioxygenase-like lactoylglutathione lyase family enzyme